MHYAWKQHGWNPYNVNLYLPPHRQAHTLLYQLLSQSKCPPQLHYWSWVSDRWAESSHQLCFLSEISVKWVLQAAPLWLVNEWTSLCLQYSTGYPIVWTPRATSLHPLPAQSAYGTGCSRLKETAGMGRRKLLRYPSIPFFGFTGEFLGRARLNSVFPFLFCCSWLSDLGGESSGWGLLHLALFCVGQIFLAPNDSWQKTHGYFHPGNQCLGSWDYSRGTGASLGWKEPGETH